ncbi:DUF155-domain-containing protein [Eremomyces bilateralis CBS 781.70]|uniref:DUF155-domain-containing protein n=1 Tax=Eremomyces bilateralis CBS 781.70 TaxID=1392243 RepID=A0A6G1G7H2_9PEZI|nr:DUF155-domain-containing protein [Eremomyces bilateralis CBS 781.70]KAF1813881.1 DUF155-domain-containing protein [Eremomyces bilateralis CBS 781.70]
MSSTTTNNKRGPTALARSPTGQSRTKVITVDNVLAFASDMPSAQRHDREPPDRRPLMHTRTPSGRRPLEPKLTGRFVPQTIPQRTSKVSEKLVLLPETGDVIADDGKGDFAEDDLSPPSDEQLLRSLRPGPRDKSYAERLPKSRRTEKVARVTAYCTAQAYNLKATAEFVKGNHGARTKLYGDCLYCAYHLPLLGGTGGYRIRSSPILKSPGGKFMIDEEIERNEQIEYHEGFFGDTERFGARDYNVSESPSDDHRDSSGMDQGKPLDTPTSPNRPPSPPSIPANAVSFGEVFAFNYGVLVFWNFSEMQEKNILADLTFFATDSGLNLATRPQDEADFEMEEFHFEYNPYIPNPRIFNDMITLKSTDHMIKLAMAHAIAQSTKVSFFEERMQVTMNETKDIPKNLAMTGKLGMNKRQVIRIIGRLFNSRVDVNLASNVLDVPNFFWESEPTLHPLYSAVREYLEIKQRIQVLNERCQVFLDLASVLSDTVRDRKMSRLTWIVIILILGSLVVTVFEVLLRYALLSKKRNLAPLGHCPGIEPSAGMLGLPSTASLGEL